MGGQGLRGKNWFLKRPSPLHHLHLIFQVGRGSKEGICKHEHEAEVAREKVSTSARVSAHEHE